MASRYSCAIRKRDQQRDSALGGGSGSPFAAVPVTSLSLSHCQRVSVACSIAVLPQSAQCSPAAKRALGVRYRVGTRITVSFAHSAYATSGFPSMAQAACSQELRSSSARTRASHPGNCVAARPVRIEAELNAVPDILETARLRLRPSA